MKDGEGSPAITRKGDKAMKRYRYSITYAYGSMTCRSRSEGGYLSWTLVDRERGFRYEIHTNGLGDGLFAWDNSRGIFRQLAGTMQFSMPSASREACRRKLKAMYEQELIDYEYNPLRSPFIEQMKKRDCA